MSLRFRDTSFFFLNMERPEGPGYHYILPQRVQITEGTSRTTEITTRSLTFTKQTLQSKRGTQSGPPPQSRKIELQPQPSSPASGTTPLDAETTWHVTTNSTYGLRMEVEGAPGSSDEHGHLMTSKVGWQQKAAESVLQSAVSQLQDRSTPASNPAVRHFPSTLPLRAEEIGQAMSLRFP